MGIATKSANTGDCARVFNRRQTVPLWLLAILVVHLALAVAATAAPRLGSSPQRPSVPAWSASRVHSALAAVTFSKDIAPIIFKNCSPCHRSGQVAPFELLSYEDARQHGKLIAVVTKNHFMPPWKPEPNFGAFAGSRRLSDGEIEAIQQWVAGGMPQGEVRDLPLAPHSGDTWRLGKPDLVVGLAQPFDVPADGNDLYRCFVIPINQPEDKYISAFEFRPDNARVVHHAIVVEDRFGAAQRVKGNTPSGYSCFGGFLFPVPDYLGLWTAGAIPKPWPTGVSKLIRKRSGLVVQVHFHPDGKPEKAQFQIGLYFAREPGKKIPFDLGVGTMALNIPPGDSAHKVSSYAYIPEDAEVLGIIPHAHLLATEVKATATLPDGTVKPLIWIKQWDFNWQEEYRYETPLFLPQGTRIDVLWTYDNSAENPRNPNHPPKLVYWGEESTDEMCELHLELISAGSENQKGN